MAHIKVVRRSMRPEEWTDLRFGWLKRYIYSSKWEINNLMIRDARQISEMEFEYYSDDYRPLNKGDMYFTPDGTAFIKADVDIPKELQGKELWFSLKTAAEICVKVNGKYVGGVDPNRERMLLSPYVDDTKTLHFEMMGYNRSKPDDERNPESLSVRGCRQIFEGAYICTVNHKVQDLVWDFELLLDIAKSDLFNEDYRAFLNKELNNAMNFIDFDSEELDGIDECQKYLDDVVFANDNYKGNGDVALIAHSHLDIAYYWRRIHAVQKNLRTVLIQLRLMDKYPDFKYTHTQPYVYETLEKYYPDVFDELKEKLIRECLEKQLITLGFPMFSAIAGFCRKFLKRAVLIILFLTKCQHGMTLTVFLTITLFGRVLTARLFWLAFHLLTLSHGICHLKFKKIGRLISIRTAAVKL